MSLENPSTSNPVVDGGGRRTRRRRRRGHDGVSQNAAPRGHRPNGSGQIGPPSLALSKGTPRLLLSPVASMGVKKMLVVLVSASSVIIGGGVVDGSSLASGGNSDSVFMEYDLDSAESPFDDVENPLDMDGGDDLSGGEWWNDPLAMFDDIGDEEEDNFDDLLLLDPLQDEEQPKPRKRARGQKLQQQQQWPEVQQNAQEDLFFELPEFEEEEEEEEEDFIDFTGIDSPQGDPEERSDGPPVADPRDTESVQAEEEAARDEFAQNSVLSATSVAAAATDEDSGSRTERAVPSAPAPAAPAARAPPPTEAKEDGGGQDRSDTEGEPKSSSPPQPQPQLSSYDPLLLFSLNKKDAVKPTAADEAMQGKPSSEDEWKLQSAINWLKNQQQQNKQQMQEEEEQGLGGEGVAESTGVEVESQSSDATSLSETSSSATGASFPASPLLLFSLIPKLTSLVSNSPLAKAVIVLAAARAIVAFLSTNGLSAASKARRARKHVNLANFPSRAGVNASVDMDGVDDDNMERERDDLDGRRRRRRRDDMISSGGRGDRDRSIQERERRGKDSDRDGAFQGRVRTTSSTAYSTGRRKSSFKSSWLHRIRSWLSRNEDNMPSARELMETVEELNAKCRQLEADKTIIEKAYEKASWQLQEAQSELRSLKATTRYLQAQLQDNEEMLTRVIKTERRKAKEELIRMKDAMVKVVERERETMRDEFMRQAAELQQLWSDVEGEDGGESPHGGNAGDGYRPQQREQQQQQQQQQREQQQQRQKPQKPQYA